MKNYGIDKLLHIIQEEYGVSGIECEPHVISWAADAMLLHASAHDVVLAWKVLNKRRTRLGKVTSIPEYGTVFFDKWKEV